MASVIHPVVIESSSGLILFDAGYPGQLPDFETALDEVGLSLSDVKTIIVSHHDHDHIGSLNDFLARIPNLHIVASEHDKPCITGESESLRLLQAEEFNKTLSGEAKAFGEQFVQYLRGIDTSPVHAVVRDGDAICQGVRAVATPGHMPGHLSLFLEDDRVLLAADALAIEDGELVIANPQYTLDMREAIRSARKIKDLRPKKIVCYHGNTFEGDIDSSIDRILDNL